MKMKRKVKGICKDCRYRSSIGKRGDFQQLYCVQVPGQSRIVKNGNMKSCSHYEKASAELLKHKKSVLGYGGIGKLNKSGGADK